MSLSVANLVTELPAGVNADATADVFPQILQRTAGRDADYEAAD